jgi:hypothetical protein
VNSGRCYNTAIRLCYTEDNSDTLVTASYAVFTEDRRVPLAVVGHRFQHQKLSREFVSITSKVKLVTSMQMLKHFDSLISFLIFKIICIQYKNKMDKIMQVHKLISGEFYQEKCSVSLSEDHKLHIRESTDVHAIWNLCHLSWPF